MENQLKSMFKFGNNAIYLDSNVNSAKCRVFIDIGFLEKPNGFHVNCSEMTVIISVLLADVSNPKQGDFFEINNFTYNVESFQAQDDAIAVLNVKAL